MIGQTLGPYRIVDKLGAGGMGEVYRATDTTLDRDVAIKVLPEAFAGDRERLERFKREAKVLAALNHPNIGQIYGFEISETTNGLVLELIEGQTLAEHIEAGAIPLEDSLAIAGQISLALEAAHKQGIIHRDLKPANVKVTPDGTVKVLDFGLAKAIDAQIEAADLSMSPTLSISAAATRMGVILGTAAYMSPEQARGRPVDRQADIWAFGCVLFEMLAGSRPFVGTDVSSTLAKVIEREPDWQALPAGTPVSIRRLLRRCLEKDPDRRLRDVGDARLELEDARQGEDLQEDPPSSTQVAPSSSLARRTGLALLALSALAIGFLLGRTSTRQTEISPPASAQTATHTELRLPETALLALGTQYSTLGFESPAVTLSPDGRHLVYVGLADGKTQLYHRDLTRFGAPRPIPGTEGAHFAFFSPDSNELGFLTHDRVKKIGLDGGSATTLCRAQHPVIGKWLGETIYFSSHQGFTLLSVDARGREVTHHFASSQRLKVRGAVTDVLPGERYALVSAENTQSTSADYLELWALSLDGTDDRSLGIAGSDARYLPSGHLMFGHGGSLMVAPFDLERLELTGEAVPVLEGVAYESIFGWMHAGFAADGSLVCRALARPDSAGWPVWSPDGEALAFVSMSPAAGPESLIYELAGGATRQILSSEAISIPTSWPAAGSLAVTVYGPSGVGIVNPSVPDDLAWARRTEGEVELGIWGGALSPKADWMAYASSEGAGRYEVWVEQIDGEVRRQVSTDGGMEPVWCRKCDELFYRNANQILASQITLEPQLAVTAPRVVFEATDFIDTKGISFRVSSDGQRLYYIRRGKQPVRDRIQVVHNWIQSLEQKAPVG
jgi:serine/threonine protein kinase